MAANSFMPVTLSNTGVVTNIRAAAITSIRDATGGGSVICVGVERLMVTEAKQAIIDAANAILTANVGLGV